MNGTTLHRWKSMTSRILSSVVIRKSLSHKQHCTRCKLSHSFSSSNDCTWYRCRCTVFKCYLCWSMWDTCLMQQFAKYFVEHCIVPSEISSTLSSVNSLGVQDLGTLTSLPELDSLLALYVGVWCVRFRTQYCKLLFGLFCVFTSTVKHYSTINALASSDSSIFTTVVDIQTAHWLWLN